MNIIVTKILYKCLGNHKRTQSICLGCLNSDLHAGSTSNHCVEESCALNQPSNPAQINYHSVQCTDNQTCLYAVHTEASQTRDIPRRLGSTDSACWPILISQPSRRNKSFMISCKIHKIQMSFPTRCPDQCQRSDEEDVHKSGVRFCKPTNSV